MSTTSYLPKVKEQYEHFPYPPRNPEDERKHLRASIMECLDSLGHYGFGGKRNFYKNFRGLIAGGGTGDSLIFLAEQLRDTEAEIVYLDLSKASLEIAKTRAAIRGLTNIHWVNGSLLDLPSMGLGKFDYINCSGVLHHLKSPEEGLQALEQVLAPGGVMGIMLYGKYGRTAIYQIQELMRLMTDGEDDTTKLQRCRIVLSNLPKTNWLQHCHTWFSDFRSTDAALYDLVLHSQDRAYSIPEVYEFLGSAGLQLVHLIEGSAYNPARYIRDPALLEHVKSLSLAEQYAIGELMVGNIKKQIFYTAREVPELPSPDDLDMVPVMPVNTPPNIYENFYNMAKNNPKGITFKTETRAAQVPYHPAMPVFLKYMDGKRCLRDIYKQAMMLGKVGRSELQEAFHQLYKALAPEQMIFLRHKDVPPYLTTQELQERLSKV